MEVPGEKEGVATGKSSQHVLTCTPCERDGDHQPASGFCQDCNEHLCHTCFRYHRRHFASHRVLDSRTMPKAKPATKPRQPRQPPGCTVPCPKHGDKMLEFLCQQHSVVICYVCSTTEHRSCTVDYIPDISETFVYQSGYDARIRKITSMTRYCSSMEEQTKDREQKLSLSCDKAIADVDKFCDEIISTVNKWREDIKCETNDIKSANKNMAAAIIKTCSSVDTDVASIQAKVDHLKASKQYDRLLIELLHADKQFGELESKLKTIGDNSVVTSVNFCGNEAIRRLLKNESNVGKIMKTGRNVTRYVHDEATMQFEKKINAMTKKDNNNCWITGMAELSPSKLLLADYKNKAIKVLDTSTSSVTSRLDLSSGPWDVAVLPDLRQAAVTLPYKKTILFVSTDCGLSELRKVKVDEDCRGIAYARGQLVVTFIEPGRYQKLSVQGDVLFSSTPGIQLSNYPSYVAVSKDERHILISDEDNHRVVKLSWEGRVENEYTDQELKEPRAVVACQDGSFYVCSFGTDTIHRVSADCSKMAVVVKTDEIQKPSGLCVSEDRKLYVSCWTWFDENYVNFVYVFGYK